MKIFSSSQLREADQITLEREGIPSHELMERAGKLVFENIHKQLKDRRLSIKVFCGIGNNGGDGLVIARHFIEHGYSVKVYVANYSDQRSRDFLVNYERIKDVTKDWPVMLTADSDLPELQPGDMLIDAIFGLGLNRELPQWVAELVRHINRSGAYVVAIDMPTGMFAEGPTPDPEAIVKAHHTFTFQAPKLVFYLPQTSGYVGNLSILDIGLDRNFLDSAEPVGELLTRSRIRSEYRFREPESHKGSFGHALLIGGSYGKMGSMALSTRACLRSGAGMATAYIPRCGYTVLQTLVPEAMVLTDPQDDLLTQIKFDMQPDVVSFGVGVGTDARSLKAFEELLEKVRTPMVIDADGLNLLASEPRLLSLIPEGTVLTPHPKELERLIGAWKDDFEKLEKVQEFCRKNRVQLVLKGHHSLLVSQEGLFINTTGNPGMATAGSGDVLTGIITGLISQGYSPQQAARMGVFLHGLAGDLIASEKGYESLIAGDIIDKLGAAVMELLRQPEKEQPTNPS